MRRRGWTWVLVAALALLPRATTAQCMGGGTSGGHDHGQATATTRERSSDKKARQAIDRLLAEERSRALLAEAVLADAALMRDLIGRIAAAPEWRALATERLSATAAGVAPARRDTSEGRRPPPPPPDAALYRCPMHPEVASSRSGSCSKCGMALVRET